MRTLRPELSQSGNSPPQNLRLEVPSKSSHNQLTVLAVCAFLGAADGWMLARDENPTVAMDRHALAGYLEIAEADAALPKLEGRLFHPYRRKWATERKHQPLTDVAAAGGWQNSATLVTCYQQPTDDALLAVMSETRKMRDVAVVGASSARDR